MSVDNDQTSIICSSWSQCHVFGQISISLYCLENKSKILDFFFARFFFSKIIKIMFWASIDWFFTRKQFLISYFGSNMGQNTDLDWFHCSKTMIQVMTSDSVFWCQILDFFLDTDPRAYGAKTCLQRLEITQKVHLTS